MTLHATRWLVAALSAAAVAIAAPAHAAEPRPTDTKISPSLQAEFDDGKTSFWVMLRDRTDVDARPAGDVYRTARAGADRSQKGLRTLLTSKKAAFTPFWIANTIKVTGDAGLAAAIAARPEVKAILPDDPIILPAPAQGAVQAAVDAVEWNVDRIGAPRVWADRDDRGAGIVIANIDTGVQFDHPALAANYRGRQADGTYQHDYNWYDPSHTCPGTTPCDNNGHGTHTMGTMAGSGGIGVAPGATWIAAKGCETNSCSAASLLAAGQWILAPTDANGQNPRPDQAPDIVNNSWGGAAGFDPWYSDVVRAWTAAGIFPAFSNGNAGPGCATAGTPGSYTATYASGAFDVNGAIASFSSRGSGQDGTIKPDIAAPGVDVRSSVPDGSYASYSGTSMASPHTAATVALIWAAAPQLRRDIATTREILDETAGDADDTSCGGTAGDNNVFGQGRLDAYAAVTLAVSPAGSLGGVVTSGGVPVPGASVSLGGRSVSSDDAGAYRFGRVVAGDYRLRVSAFGYDTVSRDVRIVDGGTLTENVQLTTSSSAVVAGTVSAGGSPVAGARVSLDGTPVSVVSGADGVYRFAAPLGSYRLTVDPGTGCFAAAARDLDLRGDTTVDIGLDARTDRFGHRCGPAGEEYRAGSERLDLTGDDNAAEVSLPFAASSYGVSHDRVFVSTNGLIAFGSAQTAYANTGLPSAATPNDALYPFWDDLFIDDQAGVYVASDADTFVVEWRNARFYGEDATQRISVSAILHRDGAVTYRYQGLAGTRATGISATIGIENAAGDDGLTYAWNTASVTEGGGVSFRAAAGRIAATFNVTGETVWGQQIFVAGNVAELGEWDPARAVPLSAATYPVWSGGVSLPPNTPVEFKYLIKNPDGTITWENGANRTTVTPPTGVYITHDTFGAH
ncbi:S8 family serine peptidase [Actinoplanes sp. CA-015351]|uniref:S8 family serine peptidase n=1 Tax=Actinoplanes sp. CA-015351 TaxID=3239897 RepID=UPI003D95288E